MVMFDETAFASSQEVMKGFGQRGQAMLVGGAHPNHLLPVRHDDVGPLATQALSVCIKRADSNEACWQILVLPRSAKSGGKETMLQLLGHILQCCIQANHACPPVSLACDGHGSHRTILSLLSGLVDPATLPSDIPFWQSCPWASCFMVSSRYSKSQQMSWEGYVGRPFVKVSEVSCV